MPDQSFDVFKQLAFAGVTVRVEPSDALIPLEPGQLTFGKAPRIALEQGNSVL